ncbi:kama family protein [Xylariaceae sp. FL0594]|nr:kama family protein [Xylariaceae sp. FL0594]
MPYLTHRGSYAPWKPMIYLANRLCRGPTTHAARAFRYLNTAATQGPREVDSLPLTTDQASTLPPVGGQQEFWQQVPPYKDVSSKEFLSWQWQTKRKEKLYELLGAASIGGVQTRDEFLTDVAGGVKRSAMSVRVKPYVMSRINWKDPANCPILRQFIPQRSVMMKDHPMLALDSLHEQKDSPVDGIVHRYPTKALFLPVSVCPTYCTYCTRSWGVGADTDLVTKIPFRLGKGRLDKALQYIETHDALEDIVVSGGDAFYLPPHILEYIGGRLINMKNIRRFRIASKGLAVCPSRFLDPNDDWTETLIRISDKARKAGKRDQRLSLAGVTVRNQTVLLRGVNDDLATMSALIKKLAQMMIQPKMLDLESQLRGSIGGFYMPNFVVDLPGGGGKRLACSFDSYDRDTGVSTFRAPVLDKGDGKVYKYYDPIPIGSRPPPLAANR